jgi:hypothetical protein
MRQGLRQGMRQGMRHGVWHRMRHWMRQRVRQQVRHGMQGMRQGVQGLRQGMQGLRQGRYSMRHGLPKSKSKLKNFFAFASLNPPKSKPKQVQNRLKNLPIQKLHTNIKNKSRFSLYSEKGKN